MSPRLRLFREDSVCSTNSTSTVSVKLAEILDPLLKAAVDNRSFLRDFADDEIQISADLFDVLSCYQRIRLSA